MCKALDDLWKEAETVGMEKGIEQGRESGEEYLSRLIDCLIRDGRMEELKCAAKSRTVRHQLYREYGI